MFIKYTYKGITNVTQVQLIVDDIRRLVTANTTSHSDAVDKQQQLIDILNTSTIADVDLAQEPDNATINTAFGGGSSSGSCIVCCSADSKWYPEAAIPQTVANIQTFQIYSGLNTYKKVLTISNTAVSNIQSATTNTVSDSYQLSSIKISASWTTDAGVVIPAPGTATADATKFPLPKIYQNGGTLYIAATTHYFFIASVDKSKKQFTPGLGVADFAPYAIAPILNVRATDTYYATQDYPTWVFMSMNGYTNISTCLRYNINTQLNQTNKMPPDLVESNYLQVKSPYVTDIRKTSIGMPALTLNANLNKALLCARLEVHNNFSVDKPSDPTPSTSHYDIGGDISMIAPIFLTANGRALDMLDVLRPVDDILPELWSLSADDQVLYKSYYGTFMVWGSRVGALGSPGVKYVVRMG
jgi:hypothetical protein